MQTPNTFKTKMLLLAADISTSDLAAAAARISERYRRLDGGGSFAITSATEATAYAAVRMPATFAAATRVLDLVRQAVPDFSPQDMLDIGAGPATATLAAREIWPDMTTTDLVEPNAHLRALGMKFVADHWHADTVQAHTATPRDLVMAGYVLNEVAGEKGEIAFRTAVLKLWQATKSLLVIIEPGTPAGQKLILAARDLLLQEGAYIAAPCPHADKCPLTGSDKWCHFSVRVERSRLHKNLKEDAILGYEDEKFSFIALSREPVSLPTLRLIGQPRGTKVVETETCKNSGTTDRLRVAKSSPHYKFLRKARWGDAITAKT